MIASRGGSVVSCAVAASPLRLLMPRSHGGAAWIVTGSYGGGLVGGDALALRLRVGAGARAFLSTQASTKVYRSPAGTRVDLEAEVGAGALLIAWPDPVVCFASSHHRQRQRFALTSNSSLLAVDWMTSGRRGSGERWQFDYYSSSTLVRVDGRVVLRDALLLTPEDGILTERMGRFDVLAAAVVIGPRFQREVDGSGAAVAIAPADGRPRQQSRLAHDVKKDLKKDLKEDVKQDSLVSAAPLAGGGRLLRVAGRSVEQVTALLRQHLPCVSSVLGDDPWARKW